MSAAQERGDIGYSTAATHADRFSQFVSYAKSEGVGRFERVTPEIVQSYGRDIADRVNQGELTAAYGQNLVSSVNAVMREAYAVGGKNWESVSPTKDCQIDQRTFVRDVAPTSHDQDRCSRAIEAAREVDPRAAQVAELARDLGLRSKEAALLDAKAAASEARETGSVTVTEGTKGGQEREVPVTEKALETLDRTADLQGDSRSVMGEKTTWQEFREGPMRDAREAMQEEGVKGYHDFRTSYACERYEQLTGHQAPCIAGEREVPRELDKEARETISAELGHHRIDVVAAYVGGR